MKKINTTIYIFFLIFLLSCNEKKEPVGKENLNSSYSVKMDVKNEQIILSLSKNYTEKKSIYEIMLDLEQNQQLDFVESGKNDWIFIEEIQNIKNEGSGKNKKNWLIFVDGKLAEKGVSQIYLDKDTYILWCFISWEQKDTCIQ